MDRKYKFWEFVLLLFGATIIGTVAGFFVGVGFAIYGGETGRESWDDWPPYTALAGAVLGGLSVCASAMQRVSAHNAAAAREAAWRETQAAAARQRGQEQETQWCAHTVAAIVEQARTAVTTFAQMPGHLTAAEQETQRAVGCYRDGAYSPFWAAMESAYAHLGHYRSAAEQIADAHRRHAHLVNQLAAKDPQAAAAVADFPVSLEVSRVQKTMAEATTNLHDLAYQAQREPTFALIWEQRRTTAAVIEGFANLETAVLGMGRAMAASLASLGETLREEGSQTRRGLAQAAGAGASAHNTEAATLRQLTRRASQIRDELYRQNWGHYPLFG